MQRGQESPDLVKVRTLPVQVAAHLTRRIVSGEIEDGRGPSELDISREFGVSRVVARETLKVLASLDIVEVAQGRRVVVRPPAEWDYLSPLLIEWLPAEVVGELLQELDQMRMLLEPELAAMAAAIVTDETLDRLRDEIGRMSALEGDPNAYLEVDHEFHMEICRAANNRILDRIMYSARWLGTASRRITNEDSDALGKATADHTEIYEALVARDPDRARAAMRKHLANNSALLAERKRQTKRSSKRR